MAFCPSCGNELPEGALFCPKCGGAKEGHAAVALSRREILKQHLLWGTIAAVGLSATVFAMVIMIGAPKVREMAYIQIQLGQGFFTSLMILGIAIIGYGSYRWQQTYALLISPSGTNISTRTKVTLAVLIASPVFPILVLAAFVMGLLSLAEIEQEPGRYRYQKVVHIAVSLTGGIMIASILGLLLFMIAGIKL